MQESALLEPLTSPFCILKRTTGEDRFLLHRTSPPRRASRYGFGLLVGSVGATAAAETAAAAVGTGTAEARAIVAGRIIAGRRSIRRLLRKLRCLLHAALRPV